MPASLDWTGAPRLQRGLKINNSLLSVVLRD
jgi:hypothetical protein